MRCQWYSLMEGSAWGLDIIMQSGFFINNKNCFFIEGDRSEEFRFQVSILGKVVTNDKIYEGKRKMSGCQGRELYFARIPTDKGIKGKIFAHSHTYIIKAPQSNQLSYTNAVFTLGNLPR